MIIIKAKDAETSLPAGRQVQQKIMKDKIRIASGQGFWGDLIDAPYHQVTKIYPEFISGSLEKSINKIMQLI